MEASSENGPVAAPTGVRRNPSIKKLLKLPMWGSGKCLNDMCIQLRLMVKFNKYPQWVCVRVRTHHSLIFVIAKIKNLLNSETFHRWLIRVLFKHNRCNNIYINIFLYFSCVSVARFYGIGNGLSCL